MAEVFTFTLSGGSVVRTRQSDQAVVLPVGTWSLGPVIRRGNIKRRVGVAVDSLSLTLAANASITINGVALLPFMAGGGFDNARVSVERAFAAAPGSAWVGLLPLFQGRASVPQTTRYEASVTVSADSELLDAMIPRNVYQPGCSNTLFDGACGLSKAAYASATTATGATDAAKTTFATALAQAANYFALGFAVGVTGPMAGRTIKAFAGGAITTISPGLLPWAWRHLHRVPRLRQAAGHLHV